MTEFAWVLSEVLRCSPSAMPYSFIVFSVVILVLGIAMLVADTGYELYAACEHLRDLDQLYADLDMRDEIPDDATRAVCNPDLPDPVEVWDQVSNDTGLWWEALMGPA